MSSRRDFDYRGFVDGTNGGSSVKINNSGFTKVDVALSYYLKNLPLKDQKTTLEFKINNLSDEDYDEVFRYRGKFNVFFQTIDLNQDWNSIKHKLLKIIEPIGQA